jgi:hypothetical protein
MRKIIFVLIAALVVSVSLTGPVESQSQKKAKEKITKKTEKKKDSKSKSAVLAKGLQINWCGKNVKDNGSIKIQALTNSIKIPVKGGKFDLIVPANPQFGDESELSNAKDAETILDFGSAKVYVLNVFYFDNTSPLPKGEYEYERRRAEGRGFLGFDIYYSDSDVKGTVNGDPLTLKKGWNIIGDKKNLKATLMCTG